MSVVWFYFDGKKPRNEQTFTLNFQLATENKKAVLQKLPTQKLKNWWTISYQETRKNPQNIKELLQFQSCPRSFSSRPTVHLLDNLSASGIIPRYTAERGLFAKYPLSTGLSSAHTTTRRPFLERPGNLSGPKSNSWNYDPVAVESCCFNMF